MPHCYKKKFIMVTTKDAEIRNHAPMAITALQLPPLAAQPRSNLSTLVTVADHH